MRHERRATLLRHAESGVAKGYMKQTEQLKRRAEENTARPYHEVLEDVLRQPSMRGRRDAIRGKRRPKTHDAPPRDPIVFADARSPVHRGRDVGEPEGETVNRELVFSIAARRALACLD